MLTAKDIDYIEERGSNQTVVEEQINHFKKGFPFLQIIEAATPGNGINQLNEKEINNSIRYFEESIQNGIKLLKFVPASGAASRMFKTLFEAKKEIEQGVSEDKILEKEEISSFFHNLKNYAFYESLEKISKKPVSELSIQEILKLVLTDSGLNYGNLPKGLLEFHKYSGFTRTPFQEHCIEGVMYACEKSKIINMHFTVSPEHQELFKLHYEGVKRRYELEYDVKYDVTFSQQKPSTDTVAVTMDNEPFRNDDGNILFRPGGHGALLENLNDLDADVIFIKNIDNVVPDHLKQETVKYKKALAGYLLKLQQIIFQYQKILDTHHYYALDSAFMAEASNFLENVLNTKPAESQYYTEKEELFHYLKSKFNRPLRVCGMVKNEGEPGGGPFWAMNNDETISLQIVESSQIDRNSPEQNEILNSSTHFNPVDLICATKNYKGNKYDLAKYSDPETGFISHKSQGGKELKALELPGLWNGAMANWNTIFVEVPIETFNPVKTINDLLRAEHQPG